jgi:hypothetical protein
MARKPGVPTTCQVCGQPATKRHRCAVCGRLVGDNCCAHQMQRGGKWVCVTKDHRCLRVQITRNGRPEPAAQAA